MCHVEEPLLFIQTPPFYYVDLEKVSTQQFFDESTSIYEISRSDKMNPVVLKQLQYFSQPSNKKNSRKLGFHLKNNQKLYGIIEEFDGANVKLRIEKNIELINLNDILAITTT